jgi:hypothetical protein
LYLYVSAKIHEKDVIPSSQTNVIACKTNVWYNVVMLISEGKEMKRTLIELAMLIGLPVMAYFGFVQGVDGALYLVKFSVWGDFPASRVGRADDGNAAALGEDAREWAAAEVRFWRRRSVSACRDDLDWTRCNGHCILLLHAVRCCCS